MKTYIAKTFHGLEEILAEELEILGANNIEFLRRAIRFQGDQALMYAANLYLRTALQILEELTTFEAENLDEIYQKAREIEWNNILNVKQSFSIEAVIHSKTFTRNNLLVIRLKDAIADHFRETTGKRPSVNLENPDINLHLYVHNNQCSILLNTSGNQLFKRNYKTETGNADINEVLAAGLLKLSGWQADMPLYNPFCGNGTIAIEAAMMATNMAPGLLRTHYGFMNFTDYNDDLWQDTINQAITQCTQNSVKIYASDLNEHALQLAKTNARNARLSDAIIFRQENFLETTQTFEKGTILMDLPIRTVENEEEDIDFYASIGNTLKKNFKGSTASMLIYSELAAKHLELKPAARYSLFNGSLKCNFQKYYLYQHSKNDQSINLS